MTTDPERAVNTSGTESVEDEDDNNHHKILRSTDVLAALRDGISAPGLEVLQYYFASCKSTNSIYLCIIYWIFILSDLIKYYI
jgi:hypothetical protein